LESQGVGGIYILEKRLHQIDMKIKEAMEYIYLLRKERDLIQSVLDGYVATSEIWADKAIKKAKEHE